MNAITIKSALNSVYFGDPTGIPILGQAPFGRQIQRWQDDSSYVQKFQFSDAITLQFHIQYDAGAALPALYICDRYDPHTGKFHVVGAPADNSLVGGTYDFNTVYGSGAGLYCKGTQVISGNNYYNPFDGTTTPLLTVTYSFSCNDIGLSTKGTYYFLFVNQSLHPTVNNYLWSEPVYFTDILPYTILINSQYNSNKSGNINTYIALWNTDDGILINHYYPTFNVRVEGYLIPENPKGINVGYLQQAYDQQQIMALFKRMKKLCIGEISQGIPDYLLETVTSAIIADSFWIDKPNNSFIIFNPSAQTSLTDIWKLKRNDAYALVTGSCILMQRYDGQNAIVTPTPATPYARVYDAVYDATYS